MQVGRIPLHSEFKGEVKQLRQVRRRNIDQKKCRYPQNCHLTIECRGEERKIVIQHMAALKCRSKSPMVNFAFEMLDLRQIWVDKISLDLRQCLLMIWKLLSNGFSSRKIKLHSSIELGEFPKKKVGGESWDWLWADNFSSPRALCSIHDSCT